MRERYPTLIGFIFAFMLVAIIESSESIAQLGFREKQSLELDDLRMGSIFGTSIVLDGTSQSWEPRLRKEKSSDPEPSMFMGSTGDPGR